MNFSGTFIALVPPFLAIILGITNNNELLSEHYDALGYNLSFMG